MTTTALISQDYNGLPITFREDGYINMTKAAKAFGKRLQDFMELKTTHEYVEAYHQITGIPCFESKRGRGGGTFGNPRLAVFFARWLDVRFAVWCDLMIDNILKGHIQTQVVVATEEALKVAEVEAHKAPPRLGFSPSPGV
jgi:hypothetical protein